MLLVPFSMVDKFLVRYPLSFQKIFFGVHFDIDNQIPIILHSTRGVCLGSQT